MWFYIFFPGERPSPPSNVTVTYEKNSIVVKWDHPSQSPVKIFYYIVEYNAGVQWTKSENIKPPDSRFVLSAPEEGATYSFRVVSNGILAYSIPSEVKTVQVPKGEMKFCMFVLSQCMCAVCYADCCAFVELDSIINKYVFLKQFNF